MKTTAAKKTTSRKAATNRPMPLHIPAPIDQAWRSAAVRVDAMAADGREMASSVEKTVRTAANNVRETGSEFRKDPKKFVDGMVRDGKSLGKELTKKAGRVRTDLSKEAVRIADDVTRRVSSTVETAVEKTLHRFNVPSHQELRALTQKVDALARKIDALSKAKTAKTRTTRRAR
ncbi:MAG: phasin family protein [Thermoanaerobaculia bacterium]